MSEHTAENALPRDQHMIPTDDALAADGCNWPRCRSPQTGKCFAWCKCRCHAERAAKHAARERDYELAHDWLAGEVTDLLAEWRKTCSLMGMRWTDKDAGAFVADALTHRVIPPGRGEAVSEYTAEIDACPECAKQDLRCDLVSGLIQCVWECVRCERATTLASERPRVTPSGEGEHE